MEFKIGDIVYFDFEGLRGKGIIVHFSRIDTELFVVKLLGGLRGRGWSDEIAGQGNCWHVRKYAAKLTDNRYGNYLECW